MVNLVLDRIISKHPDEVTRWSFRGFGLAMDLGLILFLTYFFII